MLYIAENLKALRKKKEWTQEEAAEAVGVSPQSVSKWERGDTYPDITLLPALANLYKVSVDAIIGMDKINEDETKKRIFITGHDLLRDGDGKAAADVFTEALKTYPGDESLMLELALVLSLESDKAKLTKSAELCERVLSGYPTEKVRHTARAALCFIYFKLGDKNKALNAADNLPHIRESRENILVELRNEPDMDEVNLYLRFLTLGDKSNQDKITALFGQDMLVLFTTEYDLLERIKTLREEIGAEQNKEGLKKLPQIRLRDDVNIPPGKVRITHYSEVKLDSDYTDPEKAVEDILATLRRIANRE